MENLVNKYNSDLKEIFNNKINRNGELILTTNNMDKEFLFAKLVSDLEDILSMLRVSNEKYKEYELMLNFIKEAQDILLNNKLKDISLDDLIDDIVTLKTIVLPFLDNDIYLSELNSIFTIEQNKIMSYLKGNAVKLEYKTLDEFKLYIRMKLHPYLISLNEDVRNKDIITEIKEEYKEVITGIFQNSKDDYISNFFEQLQIIIHEIYARGNAVDNSKLYSLLHSEIDLDDDIMSSLRNIANLYKEVYKILLDIEEREQESKKLKEDTITINR